MKTKTYPLYHCRKCGVFYKDQWGTIPEGLKGQQSEIVKIVCQACKDEEK